MFVGSGDESLQLCEPLLGGVWLRLLSVPLRAIDEFVLLLFLLLGVCA